MTKLQRTAISAACLIFGWMVMLEPDHPVAHWNEPKTLRSSDSEAIVECEVPNSISFLHRNTESNRASENHTTPTDVSIASENRKDTVRLVQYTGDEENPSRVLFGVPQETGRPVVPNWNDRRPVPWEVLGPGEFLGPIRPALESNYRVRINDVLEMTFAVNRQMLTSPYRIQMGDELSINDANRPEVSNQRHVVLDDGYISPLEVDQIHVAGKTVDQVTRILTEAYQDVGARDPTISVSVVKNNTNLRDLLDSIQGRLNANGSVKEVRVSPDGTVQLPIIGRVCVYGLTLDEVAREINLRYSRHIFNLNVTPALVQLSPKTVFVFGEVGTPGAVQLNGATTVLGAISTAGGFLQGANRRQVVVLRRDSQWRMVATRLDLAAVAFGRRPIPTDDVWLRPSDIIIVPKQPIQRLAEFIDLYFTKTLFVLIPNQGISFSFDNNGFNSN